MLRLIFVIILIFLIAIYSIVEAIIVYFIRVVDKGLADKMSKCSVDMFLRAIAFMSGVKYRIKGMENIDESEPLLIVANHRGFFDIICGYPLFKKNTSIIAKDSLEHIPLISYWMRRIGCFFLDRKNLRSGVNMILDSIEKIKKGTSIWIFPEGTRNKNANPYELLEFKAGAFKIAEKTDVKILPMAFLGTENIFEKHIPFLESGTVSINIGKAFKMSDLSDNDKKDIGEYTRNVVLKLLREM